MQILNFDMLSHELKQNNFLGRILFFFDFSEKRPLSKSDDIVKQTKTNRLRIFWIVKLNVPSCQISFYFLFCFMIRNHITSPPHPPQPRPLGKL